MKIIGIDPGLNELGYTIIEKKGHDTIKVINFGTIKNQNNKELLPSKLKTLFFGLKNVLEQYKPDLLAVEEVYSKPYLKATSKLIQAQTIALLLAGIYNLRFETFNPAEIKKCLTGNGNAEKKELSKILYLLIDNKKIIGIEKESLNNSHIADALAISFVCAITLSYE